MLLLGKDPSDVTEQDLKTLLGAVPESDVLEYKREYGATDQDKLELLRDITALANARGGHLLIGVEECDGLAIALPGVLQGFGASVTQSCLSSIDERILGLRVFECPVGPPADNRIVVIADIPASANAPHMVARQNYRQFWIRHGAQKAPMSVEEIREVVLRRVDSEARIQEFLSRRREQTLKEIGGRCFLVLCAIPAYFRNLHVLETDQQVLRSLMCEPFSPNRVSPSINGALALKFSWAGEFVDYLEVFRNGYIELGHAVPDQDDIGHVYAGNADTGRVRRFIRFVKKLYGAYMPGVPLVIGFGVLNAQNLGIVVSLLGVESQRWQEEHLDLGLFPFDDLSVPELDAVTRMSTVLWNAFGLEAPEFDDAGKLRA